MAWLEARRAAVGAVIQVDLPELNTRGPARVVSIEPSPVIELGAGTVVTGRFRHVADNLLDVDVEGLNEPIGCTELHPFWSVTRGTYVAARELQTGERLLTSGGTATQVVSVHFRDSAESVYNLEVLGPHVYRVSELGLLVHNASWGNARERFWEDLADAEFANRTGHVANGKFIPKFSDRNLARMADGNAPMITVQMQRRNGVHKGKIVTQDIAIELHHRSLPQRMRSKGIQHEGWNLEMVNRWAHEAMDEYRHAGWDLLKIKKGMNSY